MSKKGKIVLISGPSGVGKKTIIDRIIANKNLNLAYSTSMTTRPKRVGEVEGQDYFFKTIKEFEQAIENQELIEYEQFCENYYGTPRFAVERLINQGKNALLEIEVKGAKKILNQFPSEQIISIFISPPSLQELEERLKNRGTENSDVIQKRIETSKLEMQEKHHYQYNVINDELDKAVSMITNIIERNS